MDSRSILHLDLDAFYASVEQLDDPALRGRPVVVGGTSGRGVVCAASYEARRFGVRSAMPTAEARRRCPGGVFLPPRFERYGELSRQVFGVYRRYTPLVEPLSLDEAFLDVTASRALHGDGRAIAARIRREVRGETGLTVSAGVADCKLAAKIASDLGKPDGLVVVPAGGSAGFLAPLPASRLWGVGRVTEGVLRRLGVRTIGDLAAIPEQVLAERLGAPGLDLKALARGDDPRPVVTDEPARSIGAEDTFERDLRTADEMLPHLLDQSVRVARRLREAGKRGRVVTLKLKYADFESVTRRCTLPWATDDGDEIYRSIRSGLARADLSRPVRLTGVSVSGFAEEPAGAIQGELFEHGAASRRAPARGGASAAGSGEARAAGTGDARATGPGDSSETPRGPARARADRERRSRLNAALDALAERFGEGAVRPATLVEGHVEALRSRVRWLRGRGRGPGDADGRREAGAGGGDAAGVDGHGAGGVAGGDAGGLAGHDAAVHGAAGEDAAGPGDGGDRQAGPAGSRPPTKAHTPLGPDPFLAGPRRRH
jgi:DNA polymerase-4